MTGEGGARVLLGGKRVIVTGASKGIGAALVRAFAAEGAQVASLCLPRNRELAEGAAAVLNELGPGWARYHPCDVSDPQSVAAAFDWAVATLGGLDVLVNCAGKAPGAPAEAIRLEDWEQVFAVNCRGTLLTNQAAFPHLKDHGGRIINFASGAGVRGKPGKAHYAATKGAVLAWTRSIAHEWGRYNITCNAIAPAVWTPMFEQTRSEMTPEQLAAYDASKLVDTPIGGKLGDPDRDLAPLLVFLVGDGSGYITGQTFAVNGGSLMIA